VTVDLVRETVPSVSKNFSDCMRQKEPARQLVNLRRVPVLVVTSEASYHAFYDYCTVGYLRQAGVGVEWLSLPEVGIHGISEALPPIILRHDAYSEPGNAHFSFMELNNLEIVPLIEAWLEKHV
jgi:hypothetical protein